MSAVALVLAPPASLARTSDWRDYFALLKPRVVSLVVFTGIVGMLAAPVRMPVALAVAAILAIALAAGAAGALNQWYEADIDALMKRTAKRPIPGGRVDAAAALEFGVALSFASVGLMGVAVGWLAAALLLASILFYVVIYTIWLKRRTPQNIVIGGAAGAFPPLIGWVAATGHVSVLPLLLFAIIFVWTPPHFWALALFMNLDYTNAGVPMMPVIAGASSTRRLIWWYSVGLIAVTLAPVALGLVGTIYTVAATTFGIVFLVFAWRVWRNSEKTPFEMKPEKRLFAYSTLYLFLMFVAVAADRLMA